MTSVFTPLAASEQRKLRDRYLAFLRRRDGVPERATHRFSVRESFFADVDRRPVRWEGPPPIDQAVFDRHQVRFDPSEPLDEATLWALCVAKANRGEKYGVEYSHAHTPLSSGDVDDPFAYIEVEEFYHTRILRDALAVLGVQMEVLPPPLGQRLLIKAMVRLPKAAASVLGLCGEIIGVGLFRLLLEKARQLFSSQPVPMARIEELFAQIMVDEVGHVHFARSRLSERELAAAKLLLPHVARGVCDGMPEIWVLLGKDRLMAEILRADVDGAAMAYPDRFLWAEPAPAPAF
jgi:hypothetical protein